MGNFFYYTLTSIELKVIELKLTLPINSCSSSVGQFLPVSPSDLIHRQINN